MAKTNKKPQKIYTAEGAVAKQISPELQLRRSIMACLLWEDSFYESSMEISERISNLCSEVKSEKIAEMAREARDKQNLRHVPLWLCVQLLRKGYEKTEDVICDVIKRADELTELLSLYWGEGKRPLAAQLKKGLAKAFRKFNEYQLAKYNRDDKIKLRDVLFLSHAKPEDDMQADLWKRLIDGKLETPDTWETNLSAGKDKRETWERLISEKKLGALEYLRNLRNMTQANVPYGTIKAGLKVLNTDRVLPFRFIAAAQFAPFLEKELEDLMFKNLSLRDKLKGRTVLLVDVSGSMDGRLSGRSDMERIDAACALAMIVRELCEEIYIYSFSSYLVEIPNRRGFALADYLKQSQQHGGTYLGSSVKEINDQKEYDRIIVITDEQSHDEVPDPKGMGYVINVAPYRNGIGYYSWLHIDGWSESIVDYIFEYEKSVGR